MKTNFFVVVIFFSSIDYLQYVCLLTIPKYYDRDGALWRFLNIFVFHYGFIQLIGETYSIIIFEIFFEIFEIYILGQ